MILQISLQDLQIPAAPLNFITVRLLTVAGKAHCGQ